MNDCYPPPSETGDGAWMALAGLMAFLFIAGLVVWFLTVTWPFILAVPACALALAYFNRRETK